MQARARPTAGRILDAFLPRSDGGNTCATPRADVTDRLRNCSIAGSRDKAKRGHRNGPDAYRVASCCATSRLPTADVARCWHRAGAVRQRVHRARLLLRGFSTPSREHAHDRDLPSGVEL